MVNEEFARDVVEILKHVFADKSSREYMFYRKGKIDLDQLIKLISEHYYQAKKEEMEQLLAVISSDEQINHVSEMLKQGTKVGQGTKKYTFPMPSKRER